MKVVSYNFIVPTALVVTGGQDKTILIHSVEEGAQGMSCQTMALQLQ